MSSCSVAEHDEAVRRKMHVGVTGAYTDTEMKFTGGLRAKQVRYAGASVLIAPSLDLFAEGIALGERGVAVGAGLAF